MGIDLVVVPFHDFKRSRQFGWMRRDTQICERLSARAEIRRILAVERPSCPPFALRERWLRGLRPLVPERASSRRRGFATIRQRDEKLFTLSCFMPHLLRPLLLGRKWWPLVLQGKEMASRIRWAMEELEIRDPLLYLFTPLAAPLIGRLEESGVIFDALDNWLTHRGMRPYQKTAREGYRRIVLEADVVICAAPGTARLLSAARKVITVPNGVDLALFVPGANKPPLRSEKGVVPHPIAGYAGIVDSRFDAELFESVVELLPQVQFVVVGSVRMRSRAWQALCGLPNVHLLGHKRYEEMPAILQGFDVGLVPHRVDGYTEGMNPLKVYEYLACGLPVVSTPVAGVGSWGPAVRLATDPNSFASEIAGLVEHGWGDPAGLRELVAGDSWDSRVQVIVEELLRLRMQGR